MALTQIRHPSYNLSLIWDCNCPIRGLRGFWNHTLCWQRCFGFFCVDSLARAVIGSSQQCSGASRQPRMCLGAGVGHVQSEFLGSTHIDSVQMRSYPPACSQVPDYRCIEWRTAAGPASSAAPLAIEGPANKQKSNSRWHQSQKISLSTNVTGLTPTIYAFRE